MPTITALGVVPVKGTMWAPADSLTLTPAGAVEDRAFLVVDADGALLNTERTPALNRVRSAWDGETLTLEGIAIGRVQAAESITVAMYDGRPVPGHVVESAHGRALSEHLGYPVRLVRVDPAVHGADDGPLSLMSGASVAALGPFLDGIDPDPRRFRMNITVDGADAFAEDGWTALDVGEARLRVIDPIPRCVVITRDPDTAERDLPVLKALASLRGKRHVDLGVWCAVERPGTIRTGDTVTPVG